MATRFYGRDWFANMEIVRRQALAHDAQWGVILQLVAHGPARSPDEAEIRWQAFTVLAAGAKAIGWFTYLTEGRMCGTTGMPSLTGAGIARATTA